jgi:hypothetical protein
MNRRLRGKFTALLVVALSGGSLFGTCAVRVHDSVIQGTQLFILSLLDPSNIIITDE